MLITSCGQLWFSALIVLPCAMSCSMTVRAWCPQSVSVRPDSSVMVVVARSAGCASHTSMGSLSQGGGGMPVVGYHVR